MSTNETTSLTSPKPRGPGKVTVTFAGLKFPVEWGTDYYFLTYHCETKRGPCAACGGSGEVTLNDGSSHRCPSCKGSRESAKYTRSHVVGICRLESVHLNEDRAELAFHSKGDGERVYIKSHCFATMQLTGVMGDREPRYLYDTREAAQSEADRLNEERVAK